MIRAIIAIMLVKFETNQNVFKSYKISNTKFMIDKFLVESFQIFSSSFFNICYVLYNRYFFLFLLNMQ